MKIKRKQISVTVTRTVQLQQYHPATVSVTEVADIPEGEDYEAVRTALYKSATKAVTKFLRNEVRLHGED